MPNSLGLSNEMPKYPIEKRKRNLKKNLQFREEKEKVIFLSQGSRGERDILKRILHFREEKEKWILFFKIREENVNRE